MSINKKTLLVTVIILMVGYLAWAVAYNAHQTKTVVNPAPTVAIPPNVADITNDVNLEREKVSIPALTVDDKLTAAAQAHCNDMLAANVYSHDMPDGRSPKDYILAQYPGYGFTYGENNSYGWPDSASVVSGWMGSPEHKVNILNSTYTREGLAVCKGITYTAPGLAPDGYLIVQIFTNELIAPVKVTPIYQSSPTMCSTYAPLTEYGPANTYCH